MDLLSVSWGSGWWYEGIPRHRLAGAQTRCMQMVTVHGQGAFHDGAYARRDLRRADARLQATT
jgi:hypothetical protein